MQSNRLDRWLTLGTNISVLVGIILLIVEINQNNELVRIQIEQARSDTYVAWQREVASGDHVAPLFAKLEVQDGGLFSKLDLTQLDPVEMERIRAIAAARFYDYETLYAQYERGFVSEEYWKQRIVPAIRDWAPVWAKLFRIDELSMRQDFRDEIIRINAEQD
jgi:hypothetical protein